METIFLRIRPSRIGWFRFILEGYDGLAVLTTRDREQGLVSLTFHPGSRAELFALLSALGTTLRRAQSVHHFG